LTFSIRISDCVNIPNVARPHANRLNPQGWPPKMIGFSSDPSRVLASPKESLTSPRSPPATPVHLRLLMRSRHSAASGVDGDIRNAHSVRRERERDKSDCLPLEGGGCYNQPIPGTVFRSQPDPISRDVNKLRR
jgi:hypothetical protein